MINSIQSFQITILIGNTYRDLTINEVNPYTSILLFLGNSTPSDQVNKSVGYLQFINNTTVRASVFSACDAPALTFSGMVIEFDSSYVKSAQDVNYTLAAGQDTKTVDIDPVRLDRAVIIPRGGRYTIQQFPQHWFCRQELISSTQHKTTREGTAGVVEIRSTIFEFK